MACCPAHNDKNPSLSITEKDGKVLVRCHAGCKQRDVVDALKRLGLWPERERTPQPKGEELGPIVAAYIYRDEDGEPLFRVTRHEPKTFRPWRPDGAGGWRKGVTGVRLVPFNLPEVLANPICFICEGEKDCLTLADWGFVATCNPFGAGKWPSDFAPYFSGRTCIIIPDCDAAGRVHAKQVIANLKPVASQIITIDLSDDRVKDISDWFAAGHSEVELIHVIESAWHETGVA